MPDSARSRSQPAVDSSRTLYVPGDKITTMVRQPLLDLHHRVHGYELLFEAGSEPESMADDPQSTLSILDNIVLFGFERLTYGSLAFLRCTAEALTGDLVSVLPPSRTVLEIPETLTMTPHLLAACHKLKADGFHLAIVSLKETATSHPLFASAEYVKADLNALDTTCFEDLRRGVIGSSKALIAAGVETQNDFRKAVALGAKYFQGFYFCNPETIRNAKIPANQIFHIEILRQLFRNPLDLDNLCPLVLRDAALVYRVLRIVNSPIFGIRHDVTSIKSAIMIVGDVAFRRIATLAIQCALNEGQPPEILHMALVRARFCAKSAALYNLDYDEQYLLGMLSLLPAIMRIPMEILAAQLPLRQEVSQALLGADIRERCLLAWIECHESNRNSECQAIAKSYGLNQQMLMQAHFEAMVWDSAEHNVVN
jgi:EAL and modified HD-GYP domain-containing signal transduction protein